MHETFWNTEVFPNEIFRYCVTKSFRRRNLIPPFLMNIIFRYPNFCDTPKCSPTNIFGTARQKIFDGESWYPPLLSINFFATGLFLKHGSEEFHYEVFRHCEKKFLTENRDTTPPPVSSINFFDSTNFVKKRRVPLRSFLVLWDNKFSMENRDIPLLGIKFFATRNSQTQSGSSTKFFGTVRRNFFNGK